MRGPGQSRPGPALRPERLGPGSSGRRARRLVPARRSPTPGTARSSSPTRWCRAARPGTDRGEASHWSERAGALLATFFHAGALEQRPMSQVIAASIATRPTRPGPLWRAAVPSAPLELLEGLVATDGREQSGIWSTASGVLSATGPMPPSTRRRVAGSTRPAPRQPRNALCLRGQRPSAARRAARRRAAAGSPFGRLSRAHIGDVWTVGRSLGRRSRARSVAVPPAAPLLLVLDELANIAPLHDLPTLIAEGGSQGVVTLACLQDLAQARARWEREADGFFSLFGTKLVFPGIGDTRTLEARLSPRRRARGADALGHARRASDQPVPRRAWNDPNRLASQGALAPGRAIARGHDGCILGIEGAEPRFLAMTPWYSTSPWREAVIEARLGHATDTGWRLPPARPRRPSPPAECAALAGGQASRSAAPARGPPRPRLQRPSVTARDRPGTSRVRRALAGAARAREPAPRPGP